ncbi:MAG TPA: hypothetical protein VOB72_22620 [Candidatus Dormibacteraeota bacterium]|nr:hypothetical protein [Candidatus Dormibacteraeota bacterium]
MDAGIVLLAGHFQRYCRDLYGEAVDFLVAQVQLSAASGLVRDAFLVRTALSKGNAHPQSVDMGFRRFGFEIWTALEQHDRRNVGRRQRLADLNRWRNAIAHQDLHRGQPLPSVAGVGRNMQTLRLWRHTCSALAHDLDTVVKQRLNTVAGRQLW